MRAAEDDDDGGKKQAAANAASGPTSGSGASGGASGAGGSGGGMEPCGSCDNPCGDEPCVPAEAPATLPGQEWFGDFVIADFEYWPYANGAPNYPDDIGWGYSAGTPQAKKCMAAARARLVEILQNPPAEMVALKDAYGTQGTYAFYNWNNDYTGASANQLAPEQFQHLWLWEESFTKWISETNNDGKCVLPDRDDLVSYAAACMSQYPNCVQPPSP
jgi:hypothetical protein